MSDFEWPEPVRVTRAEQVSPAVAQALAPTGSAAQHAADVARHRAHGEQGDPDCPLCVFTADGFQTGNCRSCSRPIIWARTDDGNVMPFDAGEDPEGNVVLSKTPFGGVRVTVLDQASLFDDGVRRKSHSATCPDANRWRRTR